MARKYDPQLKQEIIEAVKGGMTQADACRLYSISSATMSTWCSQDVVGGNKNYIT